MVELYNAGKFSAETVNEYKLTPSALGFYELTELLD
jgi:hypothetical protein